MNKSSVLDKIKPGIRAISAYSLEEYDYDIKINQNENPNDVPRELKQEVLDFALTRSWSRYPPFIPAELFEGLAGYTGWKTDGILVGNGSNELIQAIMTVFLKPGDKLVIPAPTFTLYRLLGNISGADVIEVPLKSDYTYDCDALEEKFLSVGDIVVICSPNNPTGALYPIERLENILKKTSCPVIVDEAYFEFSRVTATKFLDSYDNLIILRTFSKAFSLAGLRIGYALMNPELAREVEKAKLPYNIDFFSITAGAKLLENLNMLEKSTKEIIAERDPMIQTMNSIDGVTAYPSKANFILFETPYDPKSVFSGLLEDGILVRDVSSYPMLGKALRATVSTPQDNRRFIQSLERLMKGGIDAK
ncbi:MAG: histidinol-phosphate transaminase [Candidatus Latescibacteria bacterium]|jgi:histidinol-phosphate aminotransferase|nr:histidinol-phosphate transaminase [Candidatus Latescibacterota bacterium]